MRASNFSLARNPFRAGLFFNNLIFGTPWILLSSQAILSMRRRSRNEPFTVWFDKPSSRRLRANSRAVSVVICVT